MAYETVQATDLRAVISHLARTTYGTALTQANLNAGKSFSPKVATLGEIAMQRAEAGAMPFLGHEWPDGAKERDVLRDLPLELNHTLNSFLAGWAAAFALGSVTSVQEGGTGHYTHTIRATNPLAGSGVRDAKVTDIYLDSGSADAGRLKRISLAMALESFTINAQRGAMLQITQQFVGNGNEDIATAITIPALTPEFLFSGQGMKVEYGDKGGGLTDISDRIREVSLRFMQNLAKGPESYTPNAATPASGRFRGQMKFIDRRFAIQMALFMDRANRDLIDHMLGTVAGTLPRKELKFTFDSGVVAGTGTSNHKLTVRYPDVRISETPIAFEGVGAVYNVAVNEDQVNRDVAVADSPCTVTVDNTQATYLV